MTTVTHLTQTSPELIDALEDAFRNTDWQFDVLHTGGGCMVARMWMGDANAGPEIWLTREDDREWLVGFYNFVQDPDDEGVCVSIRGHNVYTSGAPAPGNSADDPAWVAGQVYGILVRL
jgi:hypothetical protein